MTSIEPYVVGPDIKPILRHFGFRQEDPVYCRTYKDKRFRFYKVFNRVVDEQTKRPYSPHELVMELLGCDIQAATRYMAKHDLV